MLIAVPTLSEASPCRMSSTKRGLGVGDKEKLKEKEGRNCSFCLTDNELRGRFTYSRHRFLKLMKDKVGATAPCSKVWPVMVLGMRGREGWGWGLDLY